MQVTGVGARLITQICAKSKPYTSECCRIATRRAGRTAEAARELLDLDNRARGFELLLEVLSVGLGDALLDGLRRAVNEEIGRAHV